MIPKECKRLAEVDFPIAVVSKHAAKALSPKKRVQIAKKAAKIRWNKRK
jgi:hypothetical protein